MSPAKQEQYDGGAYDQPPLKPIKDSKIIHCLPPPSESLKNKPVEQPPPRPLIIYTHSPKVIHTQPRDFMALVQKLTGYTRPPEDTQGQLNNEDNESTSVVTEEHGCSVNDMSQVNSCFVDGGVGVAPPPFRSPPGFFNPAPVFPTNRNDFLCTPSHQLPFYNPDSLFLNRNTLSSQPSSLRVLKDYRDV